MLQVHALASAADAPVVLGRQIHGGVDFHYSERGRGKDRDVLFFFDSRGMSRGYSESLIRLFIEALPRTKTCRCVVRPLDLTVLATLCNFLELNRAQYESIFTNVGFVDFTPKKSEFLDDIEAQSLRLAPRASFRRQDLGAFALSSGEEVRLGTLEYPTEFRSALQATLTTYARRTFLIGTPMVDPDIGIPRPRPASFFTGLAKTNGFLESLASDAIRYLPVPEFDIAATYDAVHYTVLGNALIMKAAEPWI